MQIRFLLGPAGSGKSFRCLTEMRQALSASPAGPPLLLVAPKQTTYGLERQLLAEPSLAGYTRLHILSFERLADFIFDQLQAPRPEMLNEEGRLMVLRGLLARKRDSLKLFRASARLTGFAQELSLALRELQRNRLTPESLHQLAEQVQDSEGLAYKLQDLAAMLQEYLDWLSRHQVQDADSLLMSVTEVLRESGEQESKLKTQSTRLRVEGLWVDGFVEWSPQELDLLAALIPHCQQATLTFCLDRVPVENISWLSNWSVVRHGFEECKKRLESLPNAGWSVELLRRGPERTRFLNNPALQHLERFWAEPQPYEARTEQNEAETQNLDKQKDPGPRTSNLGPQTLNTARPRQLSLEFVSELVQGPGSKVAAPQLVQSLGAPLTAAPDEALRIAICANPEAEARLAAREILRHVRAGGRYREVTVLVRKLDGYHQALRRVLARYEIPFFLDRRESVSHHPLAELTRSALRTVAFQWLRDDWFAALKTGLVPAQPDEIDRLENEALARGWKGSVWQQSISVAGEPDLSEWLADLHRRIVPPFQRLALAIATRQNKPTGLHLAEALRQFWKALEVERRLQAWAESDSSNSDFPIPKAVHATVWEQVNGWLENVELAFPTEPLTLREWLPILDAGLASLTVGVIPPALDQVLIGAIDRSRNPDIKLAVVLGMNESVFPAPPEASVLLTEADRDELGKNNLVLGGNARQQIGRERFYAYLACTRARQRLVLTAAQQDANGSPLNLSPFLSDVERLFPALKRETVPWTLDWQKSEHANELIGPLLAVQRLKSRVESPGFGCERQEPEVRGQRCEVTGWEQLAALPALAGVIEQLRHFQHPDAEESLAPELARHLYGPVLRTSVSRMEQFAACPFKFFVHSGMRAEERKLFELDVKEQGTFQHDVLAFFHEELSRESKRWRDITPEEARQRIGRIANGLMASYRDGLLQVSEESRFMARILRESLQDFVEILVAWMRQQYQFDPVAVELPFGEDESSPAWEIDLGDRHKLALHGRIDRVDLCPASENGQALCVVVDYKSSQKHLDASLMAHGLQLQLLTYLNVLRHWPNPLERFGSARLLPVGVFYVNLRGKYERGKNRLDALADPEQARKLAYRHTGRFDTRALPQLDGRPDARQGDQFNYRLTNDGHVNKVSREALPTADFEALLSSVEANLKKMGRDIFSGVAKVAPFRKGGATACDQCDYRPICRIDPWTHSFRVLGREAE